MINYMLYKYTLLYLIATDSEKKDLDPNLIK